MRAAARIWGGVLISAGVRRARARGVGARLPRRRLPPRPPAAQMQLVKVKLKLLAMLVTVALVKLAMLRPRTPMNMKPG